MQSEYFITSRNNQHIVALTEVQFKELKRAKKRLSSSFAVAHKYRLVKANFEMTVDAMARLGQLYVEQAGIEAMETAKPHLNACVNNFILSSRMFTSQLKRHVQACLPQNRRSQQQLTEAIDREYHGSFAYRFVDSLYDYVSLYGISIHTLIMESVVSEKADGTLSRQYGLKAMVEKDFIGGPAEFRALVFDEIKAPVNLMEVFGQFNESVERLHHVALELVKDVADEANATVLEFLNVFIAEHGTEHDNLFVVHKTSARHEKVYDKFPLSMYVNNHNMDSDYV
ncbi:hypothetical protein OCL06_04790 [Alteromonas sp. ASW11-19]|uniref:Uncharacterized protein n=1 Tax=Alteromonas salexigens TaxID=2982530 RepID=A0ABT2VKT6_9ALTE|nr:hypothetical protein [Alteromonas salexigens]MCU7553910.1 hypothetical protein [Alteromonas salexigens]